MMLSRRMCAMVGGMHNKSMLDGELALIARRARRLLARPLKKTRHVRRQRPKVVVADDAVWPQLHGYPYEKVA
jgi:hypothetical protein